MNDVLPNYVPPCLSEPRSSLESFWRYPPDFGECYPPPSDSELYPCLTPVYNGKVLDLNAEFVHASLSGISIKHYYGKCVKEPEEHEIILPGEESEDFDYGWLDEDQIVVNSSMSMMNMRKSDPTPSGSSRTSGSFEYRDICYVEGQPLCTLPNINHRNSFWNLHRPELCKLTWGQQYVGTSTVTEHLHEHLLHHGTLCVGFHTEEERAYMLNRELDEYVRLKVLEESRKLPPDEPMFDFKSLPKKSKLPNRSCKNWNIPEVKIPTNENERFLQLTDDEDEEVEKRIRRSKEEFCLTIGRHIRKPPMLQVEESSSEEFITPQLSSAGEEEVGGYFYCNWFIYHPQEEEYRAESDSQRDDTDSSSSDVGSMMEPCPPLMMDEFCRAAGKVDFSDLRCDPDF